MPFYPPDWVPKLAQEPPDTVSIADFVFTENAHRPKLADSRNMFTCGFSGKTHTAVEEKQRVDQLARGLSKELGWKPNEGTEWDKVVGIFSLNTIDYITLSWATHKLGGLISPANASYSAEELEHQLRDSKSKCVFTCLPLLETTLKAAKAVGIPENRVYMMDLPAAVLDGATPPKQFKNLNALLEAGKHGATLEPLKWSKGEGKRRCAFLCYSSGTSGLPKGVMISHRNVIANIIQISTYEQKGRDMISDAGKGLYTENALGLLPMSHIYGLVVICHASVYRGDGVVVLPKFEFASCMKAIQDHKINTLFLVPPIIVAMTKNKPVLDKFDLSSVKSMFTGAAPLGKETADDLQKIFPSWTIKQGYGLTETCTVVSATSPHDIWFGSSGSLLPGIEVRVVTPDGKDVTGYDQPGELWVKSPAVVLGYLNNEKANKETFVDGYMVTGDEVVVRKSPAGYEHIFIVDRIKELIKVKGLQVAPAELEAALLNHPAVNDCAVIPIHDDSAGERPKAFIVKSPGATSLEDNDRLLARDIQKFVEKNKARHKWLKEVEFIDVIPKSPSGKILRRFLKDREKAKKSKQSKL